MFLSFTSSMTNYNNNHRKASTNTQNQSTNNNHFKLVSSPKIKNKIHSLLFFLLLSSVPLWEIKFFCFSLLVAFILTNISFPRSFYCFFVVLIVTKAKKKFFFLFSGGIKLLCLVFLSFTIK